ncbi:MAG: toxin-antitoxin system HicB family antitoxin [Methylococcaceae bacterium]
MIDPHAYNITVKKGIFSDAICFEARVHELPNIAEYADTFEEAYNLAIDTIETTAEIFLEKGKHLPKPFQTTDEYSGRVTLRIPKSLHRILSETALFEAVSLNQYLVNALSYYSAYRCTPRICLEASGWHVSQTVDSAPQVKDLQVIDTMTYQKQLQKTG